MLLKTTTSDGVCYASQLVRPSRLQRTLKRNFKQTNIRIISLRSPAVVVILKILIKASLSRSLLFSIYSLVKKIENIFFFYSGSREFLSLRTSVFHIYTFQHSFRYAVVKANKVGNLLRSHTISLQLLINCTTQKFLFIVDSSCITLFDTLITFQRNQIFLSLY